MRSFFARAGRARLRAVLMWVPVIVAAALLLIAAPQPAAAGGTVRIGVLAYRGKDRALRMWSETARYLTGHVPGHVFKIVPLNFHEMGPAVGRGGVDFVVTNTSFYVELEYLYGITRIATLRNMRHSGAYTEFGGVIFCRSDSKDIQNLRDLKGKRFIAVEEASLGGWQMAWREFKERGIDPRRDFRQLLFAQTHDAVVMAVLDGNADAGTVRTDTLERMAQDGLIRMDEFRVLNQQHEPNFPFALSTRLYPEWPFAKARHTPDRIAEQVAVALLRMRPDDPAARNAHAAGWTIPLDYTPVHDLMKELRLGPYRNYGKLSFREAVEIYWPWFLAAVAAFIGTSAVAAYVSRLNRRLIVSQESLRRAQEGLETKVQERTGELRRVNEELEQEIVERIRAEEERNRLQEQLLHTQKMEAIGLLAGGVAHDFNNVLTAIIGYANLLLHKVQEDSQRAYARNILDASARAAHMTHGLLAFSRKEIVTKRPVSVNGCVRNVKKLLTRIIGEDIEVREGLCDGPATVLADEGQIGQLLMNLATNARDAMRGGGVLTITTEIVALGASNGTGPACPRAGSYVCLSVSDTGSGMDAATQDKIFEPFFTTKEVGKGTGLGLAIVFGIIRQHEGCIAVDSAPGKGTTFRVYLPVAERGGKSEPPRELEAVPRGSETILLAEDDDAVRELSRTALQEAGYTVIAAANGEEAIEAFRENRDRVDLLLLDVIMPRKNGKEVFEAASGLKPGIPVVFTSGYTSDIISAELVDEQRVPFVRKPAPPGDILRVVRETLDRHAGAGR